MIYSSKYKLFLRLICSPIILALLLVTFLISTLRIFIKYLRYGGEWITYTKDDPSTITSIYKHLKNQ